MVQIIGALVIRIAYTSEAHLKVLKHNLVTRQARHSFLGIKYGMFGFGIVTPTLPNREDFNTPIYLIGLVVLEMVGLGSH